MGITVNQHETLATGIVVNDYYVSLGHHSINIEKRKDRNNLVTEYVNITVKSETPPTENIYDILYTELKKNFENYNDSM